MKAKCQLGGWLAFCADIFHLGDQQYTLTCQRNHDVYYESRYPFAESSFGPRWSGIILVVRAYSCYFMSLLQSDETSTRSLRMITCGLSSDS